jgi:Peptidase family M28
MNNNRNLYYSSTCFPIIFISLFLFTLTNFPISLFAFIDVAAESEVSTISSLLKITAESDADNSINIPQHIIDEVNSTNLERTIHDLSSFHTRNTQSEFIDDAAFWLVNKLQPICDDGNIEVHNFTHTPEEDNNIDSKELSSYDLKNIVCEKPGSTDNTIIISAHYDSRMEDINNSTARAPGADDNASGVSALLEVVRVLSNVSLNHSILFVLFSGEEQGKWGSTYYADHIDKTDVDLDLLVNLDMIGFSSQGTNDFLIEYDNGNVVQNNDKFSQAIARFIKEDIATQYTNLNTEFGILQNTDYLPFEELGYTVIGFHDNGVTTNPNYHKSTDTPDTLDYEYLTSVTELILATILSLDRLITTDITGYMLPTSYVTISWCMPGIGSRTFPPV